jgi:L-2-hydroxyglutarate oxidase
MNVQSQTFDIVIVGAGIMGLSIARALKRKNETVKIAILEKESVIGLHASGRNSGVLHSGIYYSEDSLKAKFCREGAIAMANYCHEHQLPIKQIGKIILPTKPNDESMLKVLHQRAIKNGAKVYLIDSKELRKIEPEAQSDFNMALVSPETSVVDSKAILNQLYNSLLDMDVTFYFNTQCVDINTQEKKIDARNVKLSYGHLYNTAGLYADKVANACGLQDKYTMIPFKGMYYELNKLSSIHINHLLYPVPDMNVPFLGIHSTTSIDGKIYLGPTAIPALGRENYAGFKGVKLSEIVTILNSLSKQYMANNQGFRKYAHAEIPRLIKSRFVQSARALIPRIRNEDLNSSSKAGIRAQLVDKKKNELVMDFLVKKTQNETHILNAVSPAFTSAFSFSEYVVNTLS